MAASALARSHIEPSTPTAPLPSLPPWPIARRIVDGVNVPQNVYLPFLIVAGEDHCSDQTLTTAQESCDVVIALDPRLVAGQTYSATLLVQSGGEMATLPMMVTRGKP